MKPDVPLIEAAREVQSILVELGIEAVIIGGLAIFRWGEPRLTRDVDFTALCPLGDDEDLKIDAILARLRGRIEDAGEFAKRNRVLLVSATNGTPIDIALGGLPYEAGAVARGSTFQYAPGFELRTCSAEDLVIMKTFAGRDGDFIDVQGILVRQGKNLDWKLIEAELKPLLEAKDEPRSWDRLVALKARTAQ